MNQDNCAWVAWFFRYVRNPWSIQRGESFEWFQGHFRWKPRIPIIRYRQITGILTFTGSRKLHAAYCYCNARNRKHCDIDFSIAWQPLPSHPKNPHKLAPEAVGPKAWKGSKSCRNLPWTGHSRWTWFNWFKFILVACDGMCITTWWLYLLHNT